MNAIFSIMVVLNALMFVLHLTMGSPLGALMAGIATVCFVSLLAANHFWKT